MKDLCSLPSVGDLPFIGRREVGGGIYVFDLRGNMEYDRQCTPGALGEGVGSSWLPSDVEVYCFLQKEEQALYILVRVGIDGDLFGRKEG